MHGLIAGFSLGLSLILAIGSQNTFVLRQGLKREYVFIVCSLCALSDALLIMLGVSGFSVIIAQAPWIEEAARYIGALFLIAYGARSFWLALTLKHGLTPTAATKTSLAVIVTTCLAFTWLNPHVYLDTVVLLGSVSTLYPEQKTAFAAGASLASLIFFFALGYGARILTPLFANPISWKLLDLLIGCIMWAIAWSLIKEQIVLL